MRFVQSIGNCRIIDLPKIEDKRGNLTFVEENNHIPFDIRRVYCLYGVPDGVERGFHAHKALEQLMVAMHGSFTVALDDGVNRRSFKLDSPDRGLYVAPMMWRTLSDFSAGAVCCVLASLPYDEADYIRDYEAFQGALRKTR